jgi:hypothetical protein
MYGARGLNTNIARSPVPLGFMTFAGDEDRHACDVISVVAEFMIDVAGGEDRHACDQWHAFWASLL